MESPPGQQLGKYKLIKKLGSGGYAKVYLGEHVLLKTFAAIKVFTSPVTDEDTPDFLNEARLVATLDHPHIVRVLDCDVENHVPFLVMNYAPGGSFRQCHPRGVRLSPEEICHYLAQLVDALQYAHNKNIIHRDIKPENILLGKNDILLLSDFGIALIAQNTQSRSTQAVVGTWAYMAPEQFLGKPCFASDQYSLGIMVYEWICGERPFQGTPQEVCNQHLRIPPPSLQQKISDRTWAYKRFEQVLRADQTFFEEYFDFWLEAFNAYKVNYLSNRLPGNQRSESNVFWLTNACGQPYPRPSHWPHRSGTGYESVSDGKTSVGMDRTDDIKKGIYQVLKIATESKPNESDFKVKTALISNIHAVRHYDEYLSSLEDVMWLVDKRTDKSKEVRKIGDLPDEFAVYNLFDGIISFTESHMRDDWIKSKFSF